MRASPSTPPSRIGCGRIRAAKKIATAPAGAQTGGTRMSDLDKDLFNLAMSEEALPLLDAVKKHIKENVEPITEEFFALNAEKTDRWSWHPRQLELLEGAKNQAKASGLC